MPITTVEPRRLYRQVADQLKHLIEKGEFPEGSRLPPERQLAAELGVSRPTVREALIALEVDGCIRIRVGSGIYVQSTKPTRLGPRHEAPVAGPFDILEARALIEGAIAAEAALRATPADIDALDTVLAQMREAAHPGPQSIAADRAFHAAVAGILANDAVTQVVCNLFDQRINPYFAQLARHFETETSWRDAVDEHTAVRDHLAARDAEGARKAMQRHMRNSGARFSETFGDTAVGLGRIAVAQAPGDPKTKTRRPTAAGQQQSTPRRKSHGKNL